jgi:hypothetical protein
MNISHLETYMSYEAGNASICPVPESVAKSQIVMFVIWSNLAILQVQKTA